MTVDEMTSVYPQGNNKIGDPEIIVVDHLMMR